MSTLRDPVGPKDKSVYVRRRIIVLVALLAVAVAVVLIILKPGGAGGASDAPKVSVPGDLGDSATKPTTSAGKNSTPACAEGELVVTPITDKSSYAEGEEPKLSLKVENRGTKACSADLGTATMTFAITSGSDQVWVSTDCQKKPDHRSIILQPGKPLETEAITWDRTRSSKDTCDISRDPVTAGGASYHLKVSVGSAQGDGTAQFILG